MAAVDAALVYAAKWRGSTFAPESAAAHLVALADEVERLRELAGDARSAWMAMDPRPRMVVRDQSEALYGALGALSTQLGRP